MYRHGAAAGALTLWITLVAFAQTTQPVVDLSEPEFPYEGEVTGSNVYVRSGAGTNWYPTTKLSAGMRVRAIGEESGWLKIVPPAGSFSYVDASVLQKSPDGKTAVTTVDGVYVKAGSELSPRKIATQQILPKGAEVTILGEKDGFAKIVPPEGSYLYISKLYVKPASGPGGATAATATDSAAPAESIESTDASTGGVIPSAPMPTAPREPARPAAPSKYRAMLSAVEAELQSLLASKAGAGQLEPLLERYRPLADQVEDPVAKAVAKTRVDQLSARVELEKIVNDAASRRESLESYRVELESDRQKILNTRLPPELRAWDYKGELRRSMAFGGRAHRYRLYDPVSQTTIAYVDIPPAGGIDATSFVNRYVGVRVSGQYFSPSARVPIAMASELAILPAPGAGPGMSQPPTPAETSPQATPPATDVLPPLDEDAPTETESDEPSAPTDELPQAEPGAADTPGDSGASQTLP